jgi:hypothetical protein
MVRTSNARINGDLDIFITLLTISHGPKERRLTTSARQIPDVEQLDPELTMITSQVNCPFFDLTIRCLCVNFLELLECFLYKDKGLKWLNNRMSFIFHFGICDLELYEIARPSGPIKCPGNSV